MESSGVANLTQNANQTNRGDSLLSEETFSLLMLINPAIVLCAIAIFGIGTNIVNIATFIKLGFKETINISLTILAVTDLASLLSFLWLSLSFNPSICALMCDVIDLAGTEDVLSFPKFFFSIVGGGVTSAIACERCVCVLKPFQVKLMFTRKKVLTVYACLAILSLIPLAMSFSVAGIGWVFDPEVNKSIVTRIYKKHLFQVEATSFGMFAAYQIINYVVLATFTTIIVWKLATQSSWRGKVAHESLHEGSSRAVGTNKGKKADAGRQGDDNPNTKNKQALSPRDRRATVTVSVIACMYIACFLPGTLLFIVMTCVPEFNEEGTYDRLYDVMWYLVFIAEGVCYSANFIVYFKTSAKFKEAFLALIGQKAAEDGP